MMRPHAPTSRSFKSRKRMSEVGIHVEVQPPYYAVIFTSVRSAADPLEYSQMAEKMIILASEQPGFLGVDSAREAVGITVSYWSDLESIRKWKLQLDHADAQRKGRDRWYRSYSVKIAMVERAYSFVENDEAEATHDEIS